MQMKRRPQNHKKPTLILYAVSCLVLLCSVAFADGPLKDKDREDSLLGFLTGYYEVIGKPQRRRHISWNRDIDA